MTIKIDSLSTDAPITKNYEKIVRIKFNGKDYLSKERVKEVFNLNDNAAYDFEKDSTIYGVFVDPAGNEAFYRDTSSFLFGKNSVIIFKRSEINIEIFKDSSWLEERILATQN